MIVDEDTWPLAPKSIAKIEQWTGMPAAQVRQTLESGNVVRNALFRFSPVLIGPSNGNADAVLPHTPCGCRICVFAMTHDQLPDAAWDCHDYPRSPGEGQCSDPYGIGCSCHGTASANALCEACEMAAHVGREWETQAGESSSRAIEVMFTAGAQSPQRIEDHRRWPYTTASLKKIERMIGISPAKAREQLDAGRLVCTPSMWLRLLPADHAGDALSLFSSASPPVVVAQANVGGTTFHAPCECALCVFVATRGYLEEGELDCNDYPRDPGSGPCSDPHALDCACPGTASPGGPCQACADHVDNPRAVATITAGMRR